MAPLLPCPAAGRPVCCKLLSALQAELGRHASVCNAVSRCAPIQSQELTFEVGGTQEPKQLRAALYAVTPEEAGSDDFIGGRRCGTCGGECEACAAPAGIVRNACRAGACTRGKACAAAAPRGGEGGQARPSLTRSTHCSAGVPAHAWRTHALPACPVRNLPMPVLPACPVRSLNLGHLEEVGAQHALRIPLVSGAGAHLADLSLSLRFFHSRSPGEAPTSTPSVAYPECLTLCPMEWPAGACCWLPWSCSPADKVPPNCGT